MADHILTRLESLVQQLEASAIESLPSVLVRDSLERLHDDSQSLLADVRSIESRELRAQLNENLGMLRYDAEQAIRFADYRTEVWTDAHRREWDSGLDDLQAKLATHHEPFRRLLLRAQAMLTSGDDGKQNARLLAQEIVKAQAAQTHSERLWGYGAAANEQPVKTTIPVANRTAPISLAEAGTRIGLQPESGSKSERREAAGKAIRRLMDSGGIVYEAIGNKFVFDKTQVPEQ